MAIDIHNFSGIAPARTPWKLPIGMAQVAQNINPDSRTIKPWKDSIVASSGYTAAATTTIYRFGRNIISDVSYWFQWPFDVDVVKCPVIADPTERTIYTGDGAPKWTNNTLALSPPVALQSPYPKAWRDLGVVAPSTPPVMSVSGVAASNDYEVVAFAYTNVTPYGEESAPSPVCDGQKVYSGQTASCTGFETAPSGNTDSIAARRLYRAVTSSNDTNLYEIKEEAVATATIVDDVGSNINEVIKTLGWEPPPATMRGVVAMANGIMVGFDGNDVCPSAQYAPYAYPRAFRSSCDWPIVALRAMGTQVLVLTWGNPYMLSGTSPESLKLDKIDSPEACVSKRSVVSISSPMPSMSGTDIMVGTTYYASQNGLCAADSGGSVKNVLNGILNREDWQALAPTSIQGYAYNGRYFGFFNTGAVTGGFCFDPRGADASLTMFPFYATGGFMDIAQDHLLLQVGTNIVLWNASATPLTATWRSGVIATPPQTMVFAKVLARAYGSAVTLNVYGDGVLVHTGLVADARAFKINGDNKCLTWEIEVITTSEVYEVTLATSADDMRNSGAT